MTAQTPEGKIFDVVRTRGIDSDSHSSVVVQEAVAATSNMTKLLALAKPPSWRASSHDLMTGLQVSDVTDTIPGELFDELFKG